MNRTTLQDLPDDILYKIANYNIENYDIPTQYKLHNPFLLNKAMMHLKVPYTNARRIRYATDIIKSVPDINHLKYEIDNIIVEAHYQYFHIDHCNKYDERIGYCFRFKKRIKCVSLTGDNNDSICYIIFEFHNNYNNYTNSCNNFHEAELMDIHAYTTADLSSDLFDGVIHTIIKTTISKSIYPDFFKYITHYFTQIMIINPLYGFDPRIDIIIEVAKKTEIPYQYQSNRLVRIKFDVWFCCSLRNKNITIVIENNDTIFGRLE